MTDRLPDSMPCPTCGSDDTTVVPGHAAYGNRARAPRTVLCFACGLIAEQGSSTSGERVWVEVTG